MEETNSLKIEKKKSCVNCGAELTYLAGSTSISCEYCGHKEEIQIDEQEVRELKLLPYLEKVGTNAHSQKISMIQCKNCGANQHIAENYKSLKCVYCANPLVLEDQKEEEWILPGAIIPFKLNINQARQKFKKWIGDLWFAPNKLKKAILDIDNLKGVYMPYWTFDAQLNARYTGQRGEYYYETVRYNTTENGKTVTRTRQEQRTQWYPASGTISGFIDDTLVKATYQQKNKIPSKVSNWNLKELTAFQNDFLAGYVTEKYTIPLKEGHLESLKEARNIAERWAMRDIGGDTQRVHNVDMNLSEQTFKHILLPIYISSYKYKGKVYNFFVNGQTGTIKGKRPYSAGKISLLVIVILLALVGLHFLGLF